MTLSLVVLSQGRLEGKTILISRSPFLVGRDPDSQLRPASPLVSNRHCTLSVRAGRAYVRDMGSTNGTKVNGMAVENEKELLNRDRLEIGPLAFEIRIERPSAVDESTPPPDAQTTPTLEEEDAAAILLGGSDGDEIPLESYTVDEDGVPNGKTSPAPLPVLPAKSDPEPAKEKRRVSSNEQGDTSSLANDLLNKVRHRRRKLTAKTPGSGLRAT